MSKVTFDYSKACGFVQDHEMQYMSELAEQAKEKLLARTGAGNDFLGSIFRLIMIKMSLTGSKKRLRKSEKIRKCFL